MAVARLAQRLWDAEGRPAGRYAEIWAKVEQIFATARDLRSLDSLPDLVALFPQNTAENIVQSDAARVKNAA